MQELPLRNIPFFLKNTVKTACLIIISAGILNSASGKNIQAFLAWSVFNSQTKGPYIELYLAVNGQSVRYIKNPNGRFQATIEVTISFKQNDSVCYSDKYNLLSPEANDTLNTNFNFLDLQRIALKQGDYTYEVSISDIHDRKLVSSRNPSKSTGEIKIHFPSGSVSFSDIELLDSFRLSSQQNVFNKNGYELIPYVNNFYPQSISMMKFYVELYNASEILGNEQFLLNYHIVEEHSGKIFEKTGLFSKAEAKEINVLLGELSIEELPAGNYFLVVEARNKNNLLMASQKIFFQRSNKAQQQTVAEYGNDFSSVDVSHTFAAYLTNKDTLQEYILSLHPISNVYENLFAENQLKKADVHLMQKFFYTFWLLRNRVHPEQAWMNYLTEVKKVNMNYSTKIQKGYETDRGRVYLQYGAPNSITSRPNEPSAYPYEIWHYYKLKNQSNRKFVFYNPDLVTNDYVLLHSDATGEIHENRWELIIHKRNTQTNNLDIENQQQHYGGRADENFKVPK